MARLGDRLAKLEASAGSGLRKWHRIICWEDQSQDEAIAAYEREHGPIGPDDGRFLRVIINKPGPAPVAEGLA